MADIFINIALVPGTTRLQLSDSNGAKGEPEGFVTQVEKGDYVTWRLEESGIESLTAITSKNDAFKIFSNGGPKKQNERSWAGKIKLDAEGSDGYNIDYVIQGKPFTADPEVEVKPPKP